ncbi:MAG: RagB/SusD family nutrient uptake outer membrane protein [Bacteroides sp.]|nr:RagB/SusD family nutrient uptake outer membrane protein [Bacteroides sp.]
MKKIFNKIFLGIGFLAITGCSDFLEQSSPSDLEGNNIFNSVYYTELMLNEGYGDMTLDATYSQYIPIVWGLNSDCELVDGLGNDATNTASERGNMNYNSSPGWGSLSNLWNAMYGIIETANTVVEGVEGSSLLLTDNADRRNMLRLKGEALTMRAMIYSDLIKFFGDIPMKFETTKTDLSNVYLAKTDRDVIMDSLILHLQEAIEYLPWAGESSTTTERITKGYAHALLANIALTRAGWSIREAAKEGYETAVSNSDPTYPTQRCGADKRAEMYKLAEKHLSIVINSPVHNLNPSIENHWYLINQRTLDNSYRENIFEIPMGLGRSSELGYTIGVCINGSSSRYGIKGNSSGKLKLTAPYLYSFDRDDLRRDLTCATYELKEEDGILKENMQGNNPFQIYCAKWDIRKMNEEWRDRAINTGDAKWMSGINVVRMRYAYVLLMYAETVNELYGPDIKGGAGLSAREALEAVHVRSFDEDKKAGARTYITDIPATKEDMHEAIVQENAWEMAGEGFRKFDLVRWNLLSDKIDEFKAKYEDEIEKVYPEKLYFKLNADYSIDMSSVDWYGDLTDYTGYESTDWYGKEATATTQTQLTVNIPSISSGLNATVRNRHLLPIASTTISASNGKLHNSYGFSD